MCQAPRARSRHHGLDDAPDGRRRTVSPYESAAGPGECSDSRPYIGSARTENRKCMGCLSAKACPDAAFSHNRGTAVCGAWIACYARKVDFTMAWQAG